MKTPFFLFLFLVGIICPTYSNNSYDSISESKTFHELEDNKVYSSLEEWDQLKKIVSFCWGDTDTRYYKTEIPSLNKTHYNYGNVWRGERISLQAVIWTKTAIENARISISDLQKKGSVIPASNISTHFVGFVMTDELSKDGKTGCGHRPDPAAWDSSLVADILDPAPIKNIDAYTARPVWITIQIPQNTDPGTYKGTIKLSGDNIESLSISYETHITKRILPPSAEWNFHLDLWQHPYAIARYYEVPLWSKAHFDRMRPIMKRLADAGQKVITTTIMHKPWNGQTHDHFDSMIFRMKKIDGSWEFDYTVFDKWVEFMMNDVGITQQINCYTLIPWALQFDYFDQATNSIKYVQASPGEEAYKEYWGTFLTDFSSHLRRKGWFEKTTIAMDERGLEAMQAAIQVIKEADPEYRISLAGNYHSEIEEDLYDFCIAYGQSFPDEILENRRKSNKKSTVYTCCSEPYPNTFTFSPPAEATWLGWHAMAGNYDGYLRWAYNSWNKDPLHDSRFHTWAAGDCYLVYPDNKSSIRLEKLIEGIQDYEKIRILKEEFDKKKDVSRLNKINQVLLQFMPESYYGTGSEDMLRKGKKIINSL